MNKIFTFALLVFILTGCGPGYETPTPSPTAGIDANLIIAQALATSVGAGTIASLADTNEAHPSPTPVPPSETERIVRAAAWPASLSLMCVGFVTLGLMAVLAWNTGEQRKAALEHKRLAFQVAQGPILDLKAAIESLKEYQDADVTPRNKENENGTETTQA